MGTSYGIKSCAVEPDFYAGAGEKAPAVWIRSTVVAK